MKSAKVLLVEDSDEKARVVLEVVESAAPAEAIHVRRCSTFVESLRCLQEQSYDLVILDLTIPFRMDAPPSSEAGATLLREIAAESVKPPTYVVGLTGYSDNLERYEDEFADQLWCLLRYDAGDIAWRRQLQRLLGHVLALMEAREWQPPDPVDVCVICALKEPEFSHVLKLPWDWRQDWYPIGREHFYRRAEVSKHGKRITVAAGPVRRMGMVAAGHFATLMVERLRPRLLVMVGICAGYPSRARLGDVVVADRSWDWQSGKFVADKANGGFLLDPDFVPATPELVSAAERISEARLREVYDSWPGTKPVTSPKLVVGPMASGSAVLSDATKSDAIADQQRKVAALDMETYGVYFAAEHAALQRVSFVSIKAVSDFGDGHKSDGLQDWCSHASAATLDMLLEDAAILS